MILIWFYLLGGLVFLGAGAEGLVRGSIGMGKHYKLSPLLMGLTVVAFGTSSPELVASIQAALQGASGIAVGNVVGSNIMNIWLILGIVALLSGVSVQRNVLMRDGLLMLAVTCALVAALMYMDVLPRWLGLAMVGFLSAYVWIVYVLEKRNHKVVVDDVVSHTPAMKPLLALGFIVAGLAGLMLGANMLVKSAVALAQHWGVSEAIIGLTIVAFGTSLPELATSVVAAIKKEADMAVGNIIGSNLFNILAILGVTSAVVPLAVPPEIVKIDMWVMLAAAVSLLLFAMLGRGLRRREGVLFLAALVAYLWYIWPA